MYFLATSLLITLTAVNAAPLVSNGTEYYVFTATDSNATNQDLTTDSTVVSTTSTYNLNDTPLSDITAGLNLGDLTHPQLDVEPDHSHSHDDINDASAPSDEVADAMVTESVLILVPVAGNDTAGNETKGIFGVSTMVNFESSESDESSENNSSSSSSLDSSDYYDDISISNLYDLESNSSSSRDDSNSTMSSEFSSESDDESHSHSHEDDDSHVEIESSDEDGDSSNESDENSLENSTDTSDDHSESSLNSEEKEIKRNEYLEKGIEHFNDDIHKILNTVGRGQIFGNAAVSSHGIASLLLAVCSVVLRFL